MAKEFETTALCGKTEKVVSVLKEIQLWRIQWTKNQLIIFPLTAQRDWLVVLQCLQDNGLFKINLKRPPIKAFVEWLEANDVQLRTIKCSAYELSLANRELNGSRYPWLNARWDETDLHRWRILYEHLNELLQKLQ